MDTKPTNCVIIVCQNKIDNIDDSEKNDTRLIKNGFIRTINCISQG